MLVAPQYDTFSYQRRVPEKELLHQVFVEHLETFLDRTRNEDHELPRYVENELWEYVDCGVLGRGLLTTQKSNDHPRQPMSSASVRPPFVTSSRF
jgi:hypothetical protein